MTIRKVIDQAIQESRSQMTGLVASQFYQVFDVAGNWVWACDVDIGQAEVLRGVPVAANNREVVYAEIGKGVTLARANNDKWMITGLSKTQNSTRHYLYVSFADDRFEIVREELVGYRVRLLTYGELETCGGYGLVPYGAYGKFDADGNFISLIG